jgi:hypothetical protein
MAFWHWDQSDKCIFLLLIPIWTNIWFTAGKRIGVWKTYTRIQEKYNLHTYSPWLELKFPRLNCIAVLIVVWFYRESPAVEVDLTFLSRLPHELLRKKKKKKKSKSFHSRLNDAAITCSTCCLLHSLPKCTCLVLVVPRDDVTSLLVTLASLPSWRDDAWTVVENFWFQQRKEEKKKNMDLKIKENENFCVCPRKIPAEKQTSKSTRRPCFRGRW